MGPSFLWVGNHPATDLCNTRPVIAGEVVELLPDVDAVVEWARLAGVADGIDVEGFPSAERRKTVDFVRRLRESLRPSLELARRDDEVVRSLNEVVGRQPGVLAVSFESAEPVALTGVNDAAQLRLDIAAAVLDIFRWDHRRVRRCANPACVLMFLDVSKSGRRRWCDMTTCGNRAKAAAHYARRRRPDSVTGGGRSTPRVRR